MKKMEKKSLKELEQEMPVLSRECLEEFIGGGEVRIGVNRNGYGSDSTASMFIANAYDDKGNLIGSMSGYFLEPGFNPELSKTSGSDTAIPAGTYSLIPCYHNGQSGFYEVSGVDGRSAVHIHPGNSGSDTLGCFLPGSSSGYDSGSDNYYVNGSKAKWTEFTNFLNSYGSDGIKMSVSY